MRCVSMKDTPAVRIWINAIEKYHMSMRAYRANDNLPMKRVQDATHSIGESLQNTVQASVRISGPRGLKMNITGDAPAARRPLGAACCQREIVYLSVCICMYLGMWAPRLWVWRLMRKVQLFISPDRKCDIFRRCSEATHNFDARFSMYQCVAEAILQLLL